MENKYFKIPQILLAVQLCFLTMACKKNFIQLNPLDQSVETNSFVTPSDANLAVMGIYDALQTGSYGEDMASLTELISDNATVQPSRLGSAANIDLRELEYVQLTSQNGYIQSRWSNLYRGIARANLLLEKIETIPFSDSTIKSQYISEAKFLRALFYFDLVRFFGDVPLTLTVINSTQAAFNLKRTPQSEVYAAIENDLNEAMNKLPLSYPAAGTGRATQGAAKALLAKVFLSNNNAAGAVPLLRELTKSPYSYKLMTTYSAAFDNDNPAESIFEIQYTSTVAGEGNVYPTYFLTTDGSSGRTIFGTGFVGNGQGNCVVTQDLLNSYEQGDARKSYTVTTYFSNVEGANVNIVYKYRGVATSANNSEDNIYLLRYADVLLMLAEALNETNDNPTSEAYDAVDAVRKRAGVAVLNRNLDYNGFKLALLHERRVEFAFENQRWFDLKRFHRAVEILTPKNIPFKEFNYLYPVPKKEVDINPSNITQNPGY